MDQIRARNLWIGLSAACLAVYLLAASAPLARQVLWTAFILAGTAVVAYSTAKRRLWARSAWICVGSAIFLTAITNAVRDFEPGQTAQTTSDTLIGGSFYAFILILLVVAAFLFVNRRRRNVSDVSGILDSAIVFVAASMLYAKFLIYPFWFDTELTNPQLISFITASLLSLTLLSLTVRIWFSTDRRINRSARLMAPGLAVMAGVGTVGLSAFLQRDVISVDLTNTLMYVGVMLFTATSGAAVLDPTAGRPPAADFDEAVASRGRVLVLMALALLVPSVLLWVSSDDFQDFTSGRTFVVMAIILALLLGLRINLIIRGYQEAVRREHLLRDINASLMRVTNLDGVNSNLDEWASSLVEQPDVECSLGTNEELAAAGVGPFGGRLRLPNGEIRHRTVVSIPGSKPSRRLIVDSPEIVNGPAQASLAVLGQSLGMALERIALAQRVVERATTERLQMLLHNASDVIALVDLKTKIRYVTDAIRDITGLSPPDVLGSLWPKLFQDPGSARGLLESARSFGESKGELVMVRRSNADLPIVSLNEEPPTDQRVEVNVSWIDTEDQYVVTMHDVTDRYLLEQKLSYQAFHDELTGLNNRVVFRREMGRAAVRRRRSGEPFAVLMMDIDDFKQVNDSLGHPAGDELLRVVANRLVSCMREGDTPVRLGGDEFAAILESTPSAIDAEVVARRILQALKEPITIRGTELVARASIGIAMNDGSTDASDTERHADIALYDAKFAGKNQVRIFESDNHAEATDRLSLSNQLRGALKRDELFVRYQPIVELRSSAIVGAEALVRWAHPTRGELSPKTFIGIAEQEGSIVEIGRFVLRQALADYADWRRQIPAHMNAKISINISGRQLQADDIASVLAETLAATRVPPANVIIEVTESVFMPDDSAAATQLRAIAELGVAVFIDDFGTGWASLHYLRTLPVRGLKLAQEFVAGLPNDFDFGLAQAIRELSASMNLSEVIAEGVETREQRQALIAMGYRLGQGYLLDEPMTAADFLALLKRRSSAPWDLGRRTDHQATGIRYSEPARQGELGRP